MALQFTLAPEPEDEPRDQTMLKREEQTHHRAERHASGQQYLHHAGHAGCVHDSALLTAECSGYRERRAGDPRHTLVRALDAPSTSAASGPGEAAWRLLDALSRRPPARPLREHRRGPPRCDAERLKTLALHVDMRP